MRPILYSFRRCPYAIRARMALALTHLEFELREVLLKDKPASLLEYSPAGTVPVLVLADGSVINQSIDIMHWAYSQLDRAGDGAFKSEQAKSLIEHNDGEFKHYLDRYKYFDRFPEQPQAYYLSKCELFLAKLEHLLSAQRHLDGTQAGFTDLAIFPFIRQLAFVDKARFDGLPYPKLQAWLDWFLKSDLFKQVMTKYAVWQPSQNKVVFQGTFNPIFLDPEQRS